MCALRFLEKVFLIAAKFAKQTAKNRAKTPVLYKKHSHGDAMYTPKHRIPGATVLVNSQHATSDNAEH